jgi:TolB-like protein/Tfp pilus assembly protein PilF
MSAKVRIPSHLAIAHVLFIDVVGYSKLLVAEQRAVVEELNRLVRETPQFRKCEAGGKLIRIPAGDGMALVFFESPEQPAQCAVEIAKALKNHPQIWVRMGMHSGPVDEVKDVNNRSNVAGVGINMAQRVMACGDAGHILASKRVAEDLAQDRYWQSHLHELGEIELKHGVKFGIVSLYDNEFGNAELPEKFKQVKREQAEAGRNAAVARRRRAVIGASLGLVALLIAGFWIGRYKTQKRENSAAPVLRKSIAVLPFTNLSRQEENAFFAEGAQDEILANLAKIADLKVISRTSVMGYKSGVARNLREIARDLGVAHIVEGTVQRAANRVRVTAQLIDAGDDTHVWAEHYDRPIDDIFAIQSEVAEKIASELRTKISPAERSAIGQKPTQNLEAYDLYLRAKVLMHSTSSMEADSLEKASDAVNLLDKAVANDPNFALAYCLLAEAHLLRHWRIEHVPDALDKAERALQAARRLAPDAGETHLVEALYFYRGHRNYDHALESLEKAAHSLPNNTDLFLLSAQVERRLGRWNEALRHFRHASELDPKDYAPRGGAIETLLLTREYAQARLLADRAIADLPEKKNVFRIQKVGAALRVGDLQQAQADLAKLAVDSDTRFVLWSLPFFKRDYTEAYRALAAAQGPVLNPYGESYPIPYLEGLTARAAGDVGRAKSAFLAARQAYIASLGHNLNGGSDLSAALPTETQEILPFYFPELLSQVAIVDAALGHKEEARREARRAVELRPISSDAVNGTNIAANLALVYSWIGERESAIEQLSLLLKGAGKPSYGELKLDPVWDSLRGDPRFEKLVEEAKQPVALK